MVCELYLNKTSIYEGREEEREREKNFFIRKVLEHYVEKSIFLNLNAAQKLCSWCHSADLSSVLCHLSLPTPP